MTKPRRALILDFDGVMANSEPLNFFGWNQAFDEAIGVRWPADQHHRLVGLKQGEIYQLWAQAAGLNADDWTDEFKESILKRKTEVFFQVAAEQLQPMDGLLELIDHARAEGYYVGIATRALRRRLFHSLRLLKLPPVFDAIFCGEDSVNSETQRKDHSRVGRIFAIEPSACVVVEDSASGVEDALAAQIGRVIALTSTLPAETLRAIGAHEIVHSLRDIRLGNS